MAKILVADDNSNIQKMVGLALKDQGIDVVAVGNGEAAVRKISDVHPDLVLADVFMPVRNGYEVCQYVKGDSALAHIPVILLVGAFDPLDEQEAQRVGADGVLKKPFVPPDPLISMVKSALTRAGVSLGGAPVPVVKEEPPLRAVDMLTPRTQVNPPSSIAMPALEDFPVADAEPVADEVPARPEPVRIDSASQPLAFGNLLETPTTEQEQEDDLAYATTTPRPELERDWKSGRDEEEETEEEAVPDSASSWRPDSGGQEAETDAEIANRIRDWRETAFGDAPPHTASRSGGWTPQKEISAFEEAAETEQVVSAAVKEAPVEERRLEPVGFVAPKTEPAEEKTPEAVTFPTAHVEMPSVPVPSWMQPSAAAESPAMPAPVASTHVPASPFGSDAWAAALRPGGVAPESAQETSVSSYATEPLEAESSSSAGANKAVVKMPAAATESAKPAADSWYSAVSSPWDADVQKASQLAASWDAPAEKKAAEPVQPVQLAQVEQAEPVAAKQDPFATVDTLPASLSEDVRAQVEGAELPAGTVEAIREETQQVTDTVVLQQPVVSAPVAAPEPAKPGVPSMEELVAKVLSQMSPEVLQAVTREILKPVVEAMVRDELNGKK